MSRCVSSSASSKINFEFQNHAVVTRQPRHGGAAAADSAGGLNFLTAPRLLLTAVHTTPSSMSKISISAKMQVKERTTNLLCETEEDSCPGGIRDPGRPLKMTLSRAAGAHLFIGWHRRARGNTTS